MMMLQAVQALVMSAAVICSTQLPQELATDVEYIVEPEWSGSEMEEVASALANLTSAQKEVLRQQTEFEDQLRLRNREIEDQTATRTRALEKDQHRLKEIFALVTRKVKSLKRKCGEDGTGTQVTRIHPKDCADLYLEGEFESGLYKVWPTWFRNTTGYPVYCDMETDDGGWTVIHRWVDYSFPKDYFRRTWREYANGFGDLNSAFWLGNNLITALTSQGSYELRLDLNRGNGSLCSVYRSFWTENESQYYKIHVENFDRKACTLERGAAEPLGDVLAAHNNAQFSTFDSLRQQQHYGECTQNMGRRPGWWYSQSCPLDKALYLTPQPVTGNQFYKGEIKIRPANFQKLKETP